MYKLYGSGSQTSRRLKTMYVESYYRRKVLKLKEALSMMSRVTEEVALPWQLRG